MFQDVIATLSAHFVDLPPEQAQSGIEQALLTLGECLPADRTTLWVRLDDADLVQADHLQQSGRWSAPGVPALDQAEGFALQELPWLAEQLGKFETVYVALASELPPEAERERVYLARAGVNSAIFLPLVSRGALIGCLQIEAVSGRASWNRECRVLLRIVADLIVGLIERKRTDDSLTRSRQRLAHTQRLEVVGRLAGGIAHDFNNFLTAIIGYSDLLELELDASDPSLEEVHEIQHAADRASSLIEQVLAFSRRQAAVPRVLDLNMVVADTDKILRRVIGEEVLLVTELAGELGSVLADAGRLEQVLVNLVVNARDAMPGGGTLSIATRAVRVDRSASVTGERSDAPPCAVPPGVPEGEYAVLSVHDTGVGIDEATRQHLFEPFFSTKGPGMGTGLGLAMVATIVTESSGYIVVESSPGQGAAFHVLLPVVHEPGDSALAREDGSRAPFMPRGEETILLVDPDPPVRHLLRRILESLGYGVLEASDAASAETICRRSQGRIDLLITDLALPRLSGREVVERVVNLSPGTRVLFTSGYPSEMIEEAGIHGPDTQLLEKPFSRSALASKIRQTLE